MPPNDPEAREAWRNRRRKEVLEESEATAALQKGKYGLFHDITPICVGDSFQDPIQVSRTFAKGKRNFVTGKVDHVDKFSVEEVPESREAVKEKLQKTKAAAATQRRMKLQKKKSLPPFVSGGKKSGLDSQPIYAFSLADQTMGSDAVKELLKKRKQEALEADKRRIKMIREKTGLSRPNIVTKPVKKGSYGTPGILMSEIFLTSSDDPRVESIKYSKAVVKHSNRRHSEDKKPFCSAVTNQNGFFSQNEDVFIHKPNESPRNDRNSRKSSQKPQQPFRPGGCFETQQPPFLHNGPPQRPKSAAPKIKTRTTTNVTWRPASASFSRPVRSVMLNKSTMKHTFRTQSARR